MKSIGIVILAAVVFLVVWLVVDRLWGPSRARRHLRQVLKNGAKSDPRALEDPKYGTVLDAAGRLSIRGPKEELAELSWDEVGEVHAFKKDLVTTGLICLAFRKTSTEQYFEIHEEMAGYYDLVQVLPERLPGFALDWFLSVAFPAFDANHQIIWRRSPIR